MLDPSLPADLRASGRMALVNKRKAFWVVPLMPPILAAAAAHGRAEGPRATRTSGTSRAQVNVRGSRRQGKRPLPRRPARAESGLSPWLYLARYRGRFRRMAAPCAGSGSHHPARLVATLSDAFIT